MSTIGVVWETDEHLLDDDRVQDVVRKALAHGGRSGEDLDVVFVSDEALQRMHADWLGDPTETDVITFDLGAGPGPIGELYVSVDCARRVAPTRGVDVARELALYVVHGVLHLCGYDDHDDAERARMRVAEAEVLASLGYPSDPGPGW